MHCFVQHSERCTGQLAEHLRSLIGNPTHTPTCLYGLVTWPGAGCQRRRRRYRGKERLHLTTRPVFRNLRRHDPFIVCIVPYCVFCLPFGRRPSSRARRFSLSWGGTEVVLDLSPLGAEMKTTC